MLLRRRDWDAQGGVRWGLGSEGIVLCKIWVKNFLLYKEPGCLSVTQGEDRVPKNDIDEIVGYYIKSQLCCITRYEEEERGAKNHARGGWRREWSCDLSWILAEGLRNA